MNMMEFLVGVMVWVVIIVVGLYWGTWLSVKLPEIDSGFDRKPFNCRPCLTFHLCWVMSVVAALAMQSGWWIVFGVGISLVVFVAVKYIDNKKIEK